MTARLRDDPDALNALVSRVAEHRGLNPAYVEKDFWVTEVLRVATRARPIAGCDQPVEFIFKGGTSLSRVFGLIDRFSEDIDLLVAFPQGPGASARHAVFKQVDVQIAAHLGSPGIVVSSTTGVKRDTTYVYPASFPGSALKEGVLLEMGSRGGTHPVSPHPFRSMIAIYADEVLGEDVSAWDEFAPFEVNVLAPERTLLEKLAAVHAAASAGDNNAILKAGRHFYDIARLLASTVVTDALDALGPEGVRELAADIDRHSERAGFAWSPRPEGGYADSPAFNVDAAAFPFITRGYDSALSLVYGRRPSLAEVLDVVHQNRQRL